MPAANRSLILVVDDDPDILALVKIVLKTAGYRVSTATNGLEALKVAERRMPDLIVLDMMMPVMDGREFARVFQSQPGARAPIIVLSAAADVKKQAREIGAAGWLAKPFAVDTLLDLVAEHIGKR